MGARALYAGPGHVIVYGDDEFLAVSGDVLGKPAREAFAQPEYAPAQRAMDRVFRSGIPEWVDAVSMTGAPGRLLFTPVRDPESRQVVGLASLWTRVPASTRRTLRARHDRSELALPKA